METIVRGNQLSFPFYLNLIPALPPTSTCSRSYGLKKATLNAKPRREENENQGMLYIRIQDLCDLCHNYGIII